MGGSILKKIMITIVFFCILLVACDSKIQTNALILSAEKESTTNYLYAKSIHKMLKETLPQIPIDFNTYLKGNVSAIDEIKQGACDIAIGNALAAKWAEEERQEVAKNVRAIAGGLVWEDLTIFFAQDFVNKTGFTEIEQVAEQKYPVRLIVRQKGTFAQLSAEKLLEVLNIDFKTIQSWGGKIIYVNSEKEMICLLNEGKADIIIDSTIENNQATKKFCLETELYFPQLQDSTIKKLETIGYFSDIIYKNTWTGQKKDISTVMSPLVLLVSADVSDEIVYEITKNVNQINTWTNIDQNFSFDFETSSSLTGIQLHTGALQYYEDFGWEPLENSF